MRAFFKDPWNWFGIAVAIVLLLFVFSCVGCATESPFKHAIRLPDISVYLSKQDPEANVWISKKRREFKDLEKSGLMSMKDYIVAVQDLDSLEEHFIDLRYEITEIELKSRGMALP